VPRLRTVGYYTTSMEHRYYYLIVAAALSLSARAFEFTRVYELGRQLGVVGKRRDRRQLEIAKINNLKKIENLRKQHAALDVLLIKVSSDVEMKRLKADKLSIKDQIKKLTAANNEAAASTGDPDSESALLGAGTSGKVFHGTHSLTKQRVAIKTAVSEAQQEELRREYLVMEKLSNEPWGFPRPHLFTHQVISDDQRAAVLVMDLLGPSVEALLFSTHLGTRGFSATTVLYIARDAIKRLKTLESHGLCHSDIHPGNMLLGATAKSNRTVHLIDFGRTRLSVPTAPGSFRGVFDYANPSHLPSLLFASSDVLAGRAPRHRDDLESLLFSLASLSTGTVPEDYWGRSRAEVIHAKAGQCYSVRELLSLGGGGGGEDASAVERVLELIKAEVKHRSGDGGRCGYDALLAAIDEELGPGGIKKKLLLDWEASGISWDEAAHMSSPYGSS
jgi:hypothetical protein